MKTFCVLSSFLALTIWMSYLIPAFADVQFARIAEVIMRDESTYEPGCSVPISIRVVALGSRGDEYFTVVSTKHEKSGMWDSITPQKFSVRKSSDVGGGFVEYYLPKNAFLGHYDVKITVFDGYQNNEGNAILRKILTTYEVPGAFEVVESATGCVKLDDPRSSPYGDKTMLHVYENRGGTLYRDGVVVESQQHTAMRVDLSDGIYIDDFSNSQVTNNADPETDVTGPYWPAVVIVLGVAVGISCMIRKIGIRKNNQVFFQFAE
ncbi:MAG: hypothetical protein QXY15_11060 [Candidatus Nitrosotenuis sp.]